MKCEFNYCIYNKANVCQLTDVSVNEFGMCDS